MSRSNPNSEEFAASMAALGPFESCPHVAVAVSGGGDSMALALLAAQWARGKGGRVTALTVDHGLRAQSNHEALQVGRWLQGYGMEHRVLTWSGLKPATGIQAAARKARYRLLSAACREAGILHLLIAHHLQDQAETLLLRLGRSSGIDGLAAMSAVLERDGIRVLRPLLQMPRERLQLTLSAAGQEWIEDPSNSDPAFARVRIRKTLPELAAAGLTPAALAATAARMGRARMALEAAASALLGRCACVDPAGCISVDGRALFEAPDEISLRALSRVLMVGGGGEYGPPTLKLENIHEKMKAYFFNAERWKGATLARCRVIPRRARGASAAFLVVREMRNLPARRIIEAGASLHWDRRFRLSMSDPGQHENLCDNKDLTVAPLGRQGLLQARAEAGGRALAGLPKAALWTLPALFDDARLVQVPHLDYCRTPGPAGQGRLRRAVFSPAQSLSGAGFAIAE